MVLVFLYLRALRNGCSESFDACHVRYPFSTTAVPVSSEAVAADVQRRQRPDGGYGRCSMDGAGMSECVCTDSVPQHMPRTRTDNTHLHFGIAAAMCLVPSGLMLLLLRSKLVIALMARKTASANVRQRIFWFLLALGEEGSKDDARSTQMLAAEVSFAHSGLDRDGCAPGFITADGELRCLPTSKQDTREARPTGTCRRSNHQLDDSRWLPAWPAWTHPQSLPGGKQLYSFARIPSHQLQP